MAESSSVDLSTRRFGLGPVQKLELAKPSIGVVTHETGTPIADAKFMQQHHKLDNSKGSAGTLLGTVTTRKPGPMPPSPIVIQVPSTSANDSQNQQDHQTSRSQIAASNVVTTTTTRDTDTQDRQQQQTSADSKGQLMLEPQQGYKHRYWRRNYADASRAPNTGRLLASQSGGRQQVVVVASAESNRLRGTSAESQRTPTDGESANESDNISDDSIPPPPNYHEIPGIVPSYHGRTSGPPPAYHEVMNPNGAPPSYQSLFGQVREARKSSNGLVDLLRQLLLVLIGTIGCTMIIGFLLLIPITMIFVGFLYINECRAENIPTFLVVGGFVWIIKNMLNCYNQFKKDSSSINRPPPRRAPPHLQAARANGPTTPAVSVISSHLEQHLREALPQVDVEHQGAESPAATGTATTTRPTIAQPSATQSETQDQSNRHLRPRVREPQMIGLTSDKCESILNYFLIVWFLAGCIVVYRIYEPDYENPLSSNYCHRTIYLYAFWLMTSAFIIIAIVMSCLCCLMASSLMSCSHGR